MRLPDNAQTSRPWRIHEIARGFRLEDVWALPTPGGKDDFERLVRHAVAVDPSDGNSPAVVRALFSVRWKVGEVLGWDEAGPGTNVPTVRDRVPDDLRDGPPPPEFAEMPFTSLYMTEDEFAAELANRTVHGLIHLGWVPDGDRYRGQLSVYVKRNGLLGGAYMAAIAPFRHLIVYPLMMRQIEREWPALT